MHTKKRARGNDDALRPEYDLTSLKGGVQGKYYTCATAGTTLVLLAADVAEALASVAVHCEAGETWPTRRRSRAVCRTAA